MIRTPRSSAGVVIVKINWQKQKKRKAVSELHNHVKIRRLNQVSFSLHLLFISKNINWNYN